MAWASFRGALDRAPLLITLDHHTDTSRPFRHLLQKKYGLDSAAAEAERMQRLTAIDYKNLDTVSAAIENLSHDEHIVTAIQTDIISSAFVIAQNAMDTDNSVFLEHKIMCRAVHQTENPLEMRRNCDQALESHFLQSKLDSFNAQLQTLDQASLESQDYILDIDLDYLNTFQSVSPKNSYVIVRLARGAGLVTVATEEEHVKVCSLDPGLTSQFLLDQLISTLKLI